MLSSLRKNFDSLPVARHCTPLALLLGSLFSAPATAALSDTLQPFVGISYVHDDNLFRVPDRQGAGGPESDNTKMLVAGVAVERPFGRQMLNASAKMTRVDFSRFDQLNYVGKDANATLNWQLGNHFEGALGGTYNETLSSFSDFHSAEKNIRSVRGGFLDANWRLHPSWRLHSRVSRDKFDYSLASQSYLDREENRGELGIDYLAASGSTIGLLTRRLKGTYPHPLRFGPFVDDESFKQDDVQLKVYWNYSAATQLRFQGGRSKRSHTLFSQRDSSGVQGRLDVTWLPTAGLRLVGSAWREFQPFEGGNASYSLSNGTSLAATWVNSSKISTQASLRYAKREFAGLLSANTNVHDSTRTATLGINYAPLRNVQLGASWNHDARSGQSAFTTPYRSNSVSLSANVQF